MDMYKGFLEKARVDVRVSLLVWTEILEERLGSWVSYAYAKGSSIKPWSSPIDYVPFLSDLDIHVMLREGRSAFFEGDDAFFEAIRVSRRYEELFLERRKEYLHVPRPQVVLLNNLAEDPLYVPSRVRDVLVLIGYPPEPTPVPVETIQTIDSKQILELVAFLEPLPMSLMDKTGLDLWVVVRRMSWLVSPTPVRLLTQYSDDPQEVWSWNRTRICEELEGQGFSQISSDYREYYMSGWRLSSRSSGIPRRITMS